MKTDRKGVPQTLVFIVVLFLTRVGAAAPAHVIRFNAGGPRGECNFVEWRDVLTFYNRSQNPLVERVLGISNGPPLRIDPDRIDIPPGAVVSADAVLLDAWRPRSGTSLWVMHLDIPEGIVVESGDQLFLRYMCSLGIPAGALLADGKASMPVFRAATPASEPQVHLGTDLGSKKARVNVGIYNQGQITAKAHVEVRRACDGSVVDSRDVTVPPDSILQFTGLAMELRSYTCPQSSLAFGQYVVITVDQPSMSYALAISDERTRDNPAPEIGITIPMNVRF